MEQIAVGHILDQLLNARESADLGEMARDLRRNLEDDVLQGDTLRLVELLTTTGA